MLTVQRQTIPGQFEWVGQALHQRLPHSRLEMPDVGHFIWEDAADEYASVVSAWWTDGFKRCTTKSTHLLQEELR